MGAIPFAGFKLFNSHPKQTKNYNRQIGWFLKFANRPSITTPNKMPETRKNLPQPTLPVAKAAADAAAGLHAGQGSARSLHRPGRPRREARSRRFLAWHNQGTLSI